MGSNFLINSSFFNKFQFSTILRLDIHVLTFSSGVIQFLPADGSTFGDVVFSNPDLAGTVFTGSSK